MARKLVEALLGKDKLKVRIMVSIAGKLPDGIAFGFEPGQVVMLDAELAGKWISVGHALSVESDEPITETAALGNNDYLEHDPRLIHRLHGVLPA